MLIKFKRNNLLKTTISKLRDQQTDSFEFRRNIRKLARMLIYEASNELRVKEVEITTPIDKTITSVINDNIIVIAVLRAALPMAEEIIDELENAQLGIIAAARGKKLNEQGTEFEIINTYSKIPDVINKTVIIVDPMIATGSTLLNILKTINDARPRKIIIIGAILSVFAVDLLEKLYPDISIYAGAVDNILNSDGYIVPGLGDAGDRICNTEH